MIGLVSLFLHSCDALKNSPTNVLHTTATVDAIYSKGSGANEELFDLVSTALVVSKGLLPMSDKVAGKAI